VPQRVVGVAHDDAVDELHDVERRLVDGHVGAERQRLGHRHGGRRERRDDPVLAAHVMRGLEHVAERRPAQDEAPALAVGDRVGQVRASARDQAVVERRRSAVDVLGEPPIDPVARDPADRSQSHAGTVRTTARLDH
jgi:hypothetical protein